MKLFPAFSLFGVLLAVGSPVSAANIAGEGFGIVGVATAIDSGNGVAWSQGGTIANLTDGNTGSRLDTFNGGQPHADTHHFSYAGVIWGPARTDVVTDVILTLATFGDGGWFGPNGSSPAGGEALTAGHLSEPSVQILGPGGWTTVPAVSNYMSQMTGHLIGGGAVPNPSSREITFTLSTPQTGINGLRVIGSEGGTASGGFVGFFELNVQASAIPEPSATVLAGMLGLAGLMRRRRL